MRILLTGADGQLGRHLTPRLEVLGEVITSTRRGGDWPCDLTETEALDDLLDGARPDVIINPAAWTAVDAAEDEPAAAAALNVELPTRLAAWCAAHGARLVHFSTDYVFDGEPGRAWNEFDPTSPVSVYGRTKLAGEEAIRRSGAHALILRTAWLYSRLPGNFLSAILRRAASGEPLRVVSDQIGSPTWAGSLARMTVAALGDCLPRPEPVTLHAVDRGCVSWHAFAELAVTMAAERGLIDEVVPVAAIDSAEWPQKARRPSWSVLDVEALEQCTGCTAWTTRQALATCLEEWKEEAC